MNSSQTFRKLVKNDCIPIVGAFNGLVARSIAQNGFKCCYVSGSSISMVSGQPDIGLVTLDGFCRTIKEVHFSSGLPVISDADTGFGEAEMCAKTVWEYYNAGAVGLHLEDQQYPKRSGQLEGKILVKIEEMTKKIEKSVDASKKCSNGDFLIGARTDARQAEGLESVIIRLKKYVDAGADMVLPNGLESKEEFSVVAQELKDYGPKGGPLMMANMTEFGVTPIISLKEFKDMGYNCVLYPVSPLRAAMKAIDGFLDDLKIQGSQKDHLDKMQSRKELYELLHYTPGVEWYYPNPHSREIEYPIVKRKISLV